MVSRFAGFVDIQVNGGFGHDFTSDPTSIWEVARRLPEHGVTAFLPTIISSRTESWREAFEVLANGAPPGWIGARPIGLHLEGPMISALRRGAHPADALIAPSLAVTEAWIEAGPPLMVTIAPELEGASAVIESLSRAGTIVSLGHSDCTSSQARGAIEIGATHLTHLFNGMSGLAHRSPGLAAAALAADLVTVGLIADGVHVHPDMLSLAYRALGPGRIALTTDAMAALGMGDGSYRLAAAAVTVTEGTVRNERGDLAGGASSMSHLIRTIVGATGCSLSHAVAMASTTPASIVGHRPHPEDVVVLDDHLEILETRVGGKVAYRR